MVVVAKRIHHTRKRADVLVFEGGRMVVVTKEPTTLKNEHAGSFSKVVGWWW